MRTHQPKSFAEWFVDEKTLDLRLAVFIPEVAMHTERVSC